MIQKVLNRFFIIEKGKEKLSIKLFKKSCLIGTLLFFVDIIIPHESTLLEPLTILLGSISIISYVLMSFSNCLKVGRNKLPLVVKAFPFVVCVALLIYEVGTILFARDETSISLNIGLTLAYSLLSLLSSAYLYNGYRAKKKYET